MGDFIILLSVTIDQEDKNSKARKKLNYTINDWSN